MSVRYFASTVNVWKPLSPLLLSVTPTATR